MIRLRQLQALEFVLASRTMTVAAELFGVTQPAMSRLITQLEDEVGCQLLIRERGHIALTAEGVQFYREAKNILASARQLMTVADELRKAPEVTIRIASMPGMVNDLIERAISAFTADHPQARISIEVQNRGQLEKIIETQRFDIALATLPINVSPSISITSLKVLPVVCIVPRSHSLARRRSLNAEDLRDAPFVSFRRGSLLRERVDELFGRLRIKRAMLYESHSAEIVCEMVAAGMGVAIIHPFLRLSSRYPFAVKRFTPEIMMEYAMLQRSLDNVGRHTEKLAQMIKAIASAA